MHRVIHQKNQCISRGMEKSHCTLFFPAVTEWSWRDEASYVGFWIQRISYLVAK